MPKPIAPNPWRRGRRRSGGQGAQGINGSEGRAGGHHDAGSTHRTDHSEDARSNGASTSATAQRAAPLVPGRAQVIGLFADRSSAEAACRALSERGYREDAIKILISEETMTRYFSDYRDRVMSLGGSAIDNVPRSGAAFSHRPKSCPASLDIAIWTTPGESAASATAALAEVLTGSGLAYDSVAEYERALRSGAVLLKVVTRTVDDARLIAIEWRRSYRAEKVHS